MPEDDSSKIVEEKVKRIVVAFALLFLAIATPYMIHKTVRDATLLFGTSTVQAQALPKEIKERAQSPKDQADLYSAPTVQLPPGQKFVAILPRDGADSPTNLRRWSDLYMTEDRPVGEKPRHLTIYGPGSSPHSWAAQFYIQEH